jgi:hypothetical protein
VVRDDMAILGEERIDLDAIDRRGETAERPSRVFSGQTPYPVAPAIISGLPAVMLKSYRFFCRRV